ncbi:calcium-independent phospholipase A2 VIA-like protein [Euroglyphus maynei]|uniref:Calcium-independent phospholipase A2 VIA-like protein n=1 Tax=Euroglyphus maynei TaxID=6958 RepID=A0A1Y3BAB8_EURMA|nr:calcium-independent phospholipase A2 VIA-like protein [Euroglyphus maynei]
MILDGGINDSFMNPLIQIILLNELQQYLHRPLQDYFDIIAGTSFGFTTGCSLANGKKLFDILNFYLKLRSNFRKPLIRMQEQNTDRLEQTLLTMFNDPKTLADIRKENNKHLILTTTVVDNIPAKLKIVDDQTENLTLWKACRISGLGAGLFKTIEHEGIPYFDGSLIAPNPTTDILSFYHNHQILGKESMNMLLPFRLILSLGSGKIAYRTNVTPIDLNSFRLYAPNLRVYFNYFRQLRDWFASILMETDGHIVQR